MSSRAGPISSVRVQRIKIAVTIAAFAIAAILYAIGTRAPQPVEADDRRPVDMLCTHCERHFSVGFEEFARAAGAISDVGRMPAAGTGRGRSISERAVTMACPSCGQRIGKPASHCLRHDLYYVKHTPKGANARCPKCSPKTGAAS